MSAYLTLPGSVALSAFRIGRLLDLLRAVDDRVAAVSATFFHLVWSDAALSPDERQRVAALLDDGLGGPPTAVDGPGVWVIPRIGTVSPWASKATDIARNCGIAGVHRIERGIEYRIAPRRGLLGTRPFAAEALEGFAAVLHDRMTETALTAAPDPAQVFASLPGRPMARIAVGARGRAALEEANQALGLALSDDEIGYLEQAFGRAGRDPTDVELMMFAQANSEHCRHKIFNASWTVDGTAQPTSLFGMIRETHAAHPQGTVVAYSDKQDLALEYIKWFAQPDVQKKWWALGGYSAANAVLLDPGFKDSAPFAADFLKAMSGVQDFWQEPTYAELLQAMQKRTHDYVVAGQGTAQEALDKLIADWTETFEDDGKL